MELRMFLVLEVFVTRWHKGGQFVDIYCSHVQTTDITEPHSFLLGLES